VQQRIGAVIRAYEEQGFHRTGTAVDRQSGEWLAGEVRRIGVEPSFEPFALSRVDPVDATLAVNGRVIDGLPLFDGGVTGIAGIDGTLGTLESPAPIGLVDLPPNGAEAGALGEARRQSGADAIVAVTRGGGTARRLSALRPSVPVVATTDRDDTARRLAIYWGVRPMCVEIGEDVDATGAAVGRQLVARGIVSSGATVVLVSINADLARTDANYLKIQRL